MIDEAQQATPGSVRFARWSAAGTPIEVTRATSVRILSVALLLGLLAERLFFGHRAGLNVALACVAVLLAAVAVRRRGTRLDRADVWLPAAAMAFAVLPAIRSDATLVAFDVLAALVLLGAAAVALCGTAVTQADRAGLRRLALGAMEVTATGVVPLAGAALGRIRYRADTFARAAPVLRGLLLAIPVLAVFVVLFAAADAVFSRVMLDALTRPPDVGDAPARLLFVVVVAWGAAGFLLAAASSVLWSRRAGELARTPGAEREPRGTEATVVLVAVDALFLVFLTIQAAYLFGGRDTLAETGMTYSEYARRGFFELIAAAVVSSALLVALDIVAPGGGRVRKLAGVLLPAATGLVLVSALVRLGLYQSAYGWTELRFYAVAMIGWLAVVLVALTVSQLSGARWLAHAAVGAGLVVAFAVNIIGPQAFVARENVARLLDPSRVPPGGRSGLDEQYLLRLGDDAVPVLTEAFPLLPAADAAPVGRALLRRLRALEADRSVDELASWNFARFRAREALRSVRPLLEGS